MPPVLIMTAPPAPAPAQRKPDKDLGPDARKLGGFQPAIIRRTEILMISIGPLRPRRRRSDDLVSFGRRPQIVRYGEPLVSFRRYV